TYPAPHAGACREHHVQRCKHHVSTSPKKRAVCGITFPQALITEPANWTTCTATDRVAPERPAPHRPSVATMLRSAKAEAQMARTKKSAPSAPTADQLEQKLFDLADQLEQRLLGFPPLMKIFQAVGIDPASPDAKLLITFMKVSLYYGINARFKGRRSEIRPR